MLAADPSIGRMLAIGQCGSTRCTQAVRPFIVTSFQTHTAALQLNTRIPLADTSLVPFAAIGAATTLVVRRPKTWQRRALKVCVHAGGATAGSGEVVSATPSCSSTRPPAAAPIARGIGQVVEKLYDKFNACDADGTAECFTNDVVYEDLLLGSSTLVESREDFRELIQTHPVFVSKWLCDSLRLPAPDCAIRVDNISEDPDKSTVGVSWHVEVQGKPIAMGRGLSFMRICPETGLIERAVDIAEAPWRVVGFILSPFARTARQAARFGRVTNAAREPPAVAAAVVSALAPPALLFGVFLDRDFLYSLREDINMLVAFRDSLQLDNFML